MQQTGAPTPGDDADISIGTEERRGTPDGMSTDDVETRSEMARFLGTSAFPGTREELLAKAGENDAPAHVLGRIRSAPEGPFENMQDLARAVGIGTEEHRQ